MKKALLLLFSLCLIGCGSGDDPVEVRTEFHPPEVIPNTQAGLIDLHGVELQTYPDFRVCGQYRVSIRHSKLFALEPEQQAAIRKALQTWNDMVGVELFVEVSTDLCVNDDIGMTIVANTNGLMNATNEWRARAAGTGVRDCYCNIQADYDSSFYWNLWAHELGHCLGLGHASDPRSIMYQYAQSTDFTTEMVDLVTKMRNPDFFGWQEIHPSKKCDSYR